MPTVPSPPSRERGVPTGRSAVWEVDQHSAAALDEHIFHPSRLRPLIVISPSPQRGDTPLIDPLLLHEHTEGQAEIVVLKDRQTAHLLREMAPALAVWGGAARIFHPNADRNDSRHRHPLICVTPGRQDQALADIRDRLRLPNSCVYSTSTSAAAPAESQAKDFSADLGIRTRLKAEIRRLQAALTERDQSLSALRQEVQRLSKQLKAAEGRAGIVIPPVCADPERQFRYEVEQTWLRTVPEADRADYPLCDYRVGPDWLTSLEQIELIDRRKVTEVTVEVLTNRAMTMPGRQVHPVRTKEGGSARPLVRTRDQVVAMRCHLKNQTAGAPRLMWWRLPDHIELGRVVLHDDIHLR